jgi:hypothetical protein
MRFLMHVSSRSQRFFARCTFSLAGSRPHVSVRVSPGDRNIVNVSNDLVLAGRTEPPARSPYGRIPFKNATQSLPLLTSYQDHANPVLIEGMPVSMLGMPLACLQSGTECYNTINVRCSVEGTSTTGKPCGLRSKKSRRAIPRSLPHRLDLPKVLLSGSVRSPVVCKRERAAGRATCGLCHCACELRFVFCFSA